MSQAPPNVVTALPRGAFKIVLFGMPDTGKSSLLDALAQAAQVQEHVLAAKLIDRSHGLMELQRRLNEPRPRELLDEVTPYPIVLEPLPPRNGQSPTARTEAVLFDCDGRVASELLANKDALSGALVQRGLARAILSADTLVLCADIAAEAAQIKRDFNLFARFLRLLERSRGERAEVAGMPVYLVLTKCDLLATPNDSAVAWMERVEDRKRAVHQKFLEFLEQQAARDEMPFGTVDLHVWATAVKRPALAGAPAKPKEPYGVAELFRQCLDSARDFRTRRRQATRHLGVALGVLGVLIAFLLLLGLFFASTQRESEITRFESEIRAFRAVNSETHADRLKEPREDTIKALKQFKENPQFDQLPSELKQYVVGHLLELEAFENYQRKFAEYRKQENLPTAPRDCQTNGQLDKMAEVLEKIPVLEEYRTAWAGTEAVRRENDWPPEIDVMKRAVKEAGENFDKLIDLAGKWRNEDSSTKQTNYLREIKTILNKFDPLNKKPEVKIPGSRVTYGDILRFDRIDAKYTAWNEELEKRHVFLGYKLKEKLEQK